MRNLLGIFLIVTITLASCDKDDLPETVKSNDPVFMVKGSLGTENIEIIAGDNNQYMYTDFSERERVKLFYGDINNGDNSFKISVHNGNLDNEKLELLTNKPEFKITRSSDVPIFQYTIDSFANETKINTIEWFVNGDFYSQNMIQLYDHGIYDVCAKVTYNDGEVAELCNEVILGYKKHAIGQPIHIIGNTGRLFVSNNSTFLIDNVQWYIDDALVSESQEFTTSSYTGIVNVTAVVHYSNGVTREKSIVVDFDQEGRFIQDFSYAENMSDLENDYTADIRFKYKGEIWTSDIPENNNAAISISKYEKYKENINGIPVSIAHGTLDCKLKRLSDGEIRDASLKITFGLPQND